MNISYYKNAHKEEMGRWPGSSVWTENGSRKTQGIRLGKVINKEKLIFYKSGQGYYRFDPSDQSCHDVPPEELAACLTQLDHRRRRTPVIVTFGGSYFLSRLLSEIEYMPVIDSIEYGNPDRLHSMFLYYALSNQANCRAETWYMHSFAKYLYPKANLASQRISEFLAAIGRPENVRTFLVNHIDYLLDATDQEKCVLIDSTGCPNKCSLYVTRLSVHESQVNIEFRVIVVVQKSTGLPLYYKIIPGNVVDIATVMYVIRLMKNLSCEVEYVLGDAGYCCPAVMERMIWAGVDFMTRLCPHFNIFKDVVADHLSELACPENLVDYRGRKVYMLKTKKVIAHQKETGEPVEGYVYLCRDIQAYHSKVDHLMNSKKYPSMTKEEFLAACNKFGLFAIVSTRDLPPEQVLPEYYIRQGIEQFFDFAKNFGRFLPVRCHNMETLSGHMLLGFTVTFVVCLIEYRLNLVDSRYVVVRETMQDAAVTLKDGDAVFVENDGEIELTIEQEILKDIYRESAGELFGALEKQMADVFDTEIDPEPTVETNSLYEAYGLHCPEYVEYKDDNVFPVLREGDVDECSKILAFARKLTLSDEEIKAKRAAAKQKKLEKAAAMQGFTLGTAAPEAGADGTPVRRPPGRPKGSRNKKTLERERLAAEAAAKGTDSVSTDASNGGTDADTSSSPVRRPPGRPKGSRNKKTLERERLAAEAAAAKANATSSASETPPAE